MAVPDLVDAVTKVGDAVPALMLRDGDGNAVALA